MNDYTSNAGKPIILDPFLGSGTTIRASLDLTRKCIGIEIEEKYCEIAAKRCCQSVMNLNPEPFNMSISKGEIEPRFYNMLQSDLFRDSHIDLG